MDRGVYGDDANDAKNDDGTYGHIVMAYNSHSDYVSNSYMYLLNMKFQLTKNIDLYNIMLLSYSITVLYSTDAECVDT
jgi:hypothetical protein